VLRWLNAREWHETVKQIGPDVMDTAVADGVLAGALKASPLPIGEALLEQSLVSGLGNVARCETLFRAHVLPGHRACELSDAELISVVTAAREVMRESYQRGGRWESRVYQRTTEPCGLCRTPIRSVRLAPSRRMLFYCPQCQV
jgi:formamidopyrimidine-DNA glycosylase